MSNTPILSVCMICYEHENNIIQAVESVFMQQTNFEYEFVIANDCSLDNTDAIIRGIIKDYNNGIIIRYFSHPKNLGLSQNFLFALDQCQGKYIAICEGDDYWTDPLKLQRQVDFLEHHNSYSMVVENGLVINSVFGTEYKFNKEISETEYSIIHLLESRKFPTSSVMFRQKFISDIFKFNQLVDTILWCYLSTKGKIKYFPNVSSVYRRTKTGFVESSNGLSWAKIIESWNDQIKTIVETSEVNEYFDYSILDQRNFNEYWSAFISYSFKNDLRYKFICLMGCFKFDKQRTFKNLYKTFLKRMQLF